MSNYIKECLCWWDSNMWLFKNLTRELDIFNRVYCYKFIPPRHEYRRHPLKSWRLQLTRAWRWKLLKISRPKAITDVEPWRARGQHGTRHKYWSQPVGSWQVTRASMWKLLKISVTDDMKVKRSKEGGATEGWWSTCNQHQVLMPSQQCLIIFLCVSAHRGPFQTDTEMRPSHVGHKQPLMSMGITRHPIKTQYM